jgi:geranylgeranyl diphosphate synthase, type II
MSSDAWRLENYLTQRIGIVDAELERLLPAAENRPVRLHEAMRYSIFAGGKRIRPILLLAACDAVGGHYETALPAACAIEMIHTYSLIHDDLPAMDDDDLRRGVPTNHCVYGEATAILAGDALLTEAFALLSRPDIMKEVPAENRLEMIQLLAHHAGTRGMVGGQMVDMDVEGLTVDLPTLEYIHTRKTGALILASVAVGALVGGADAKQMDALCRYAKACGLAFQIADDVLDVVAEQSQLGKNIGSDEKRGKVTYPALLGIAEARSRAQELKDIAVEALDDFGDSARPLRAIAEYIIDRSH